MGNDTIAWLTWVLVPGLGPKRSQALLNHLDSPQALFKSPASLPLPESIKKTLHEINTLGEQHPVHQRAHQQYQWAQQNPDHHLLCPSDDDYPAALAGIDSSPLVLWAHGQLSALQSTQVAVVGSRNASPNAIRHTQNLCFDLAQQGLTITSGGAHGIDGAAHTAAIRAAGASIAVLGCGVDVVYPKNHRSLFQSLTERGLLLSEYPLGTQPRPGHFPRRNRIISALSSLVLVMEAEIKSGTLVTAQHALEQGRDIFAMPGDIANPNTAGCHKLIQEGAYLLHCADDVLSHLSFVRHNNPQAVDHVQSAYTDLQQCILRLLQSGVMPLDTLSFHLGQPAHTLLEPILELELEGQIEQQPGGYGLACIA